MEWCPKVEVSKAHGKFLNRMDSWKKKEEVTVQEWEHVLSERLEILSRISKYSDQVHAWSALNELMDVWEREDNWARDIQQGCQVVRKRKLDANPGCLEHCMHSLVGALLIASPHWSTHVRWFQAQAVLNEFFGACTLWHSLFGAL
jgi:hypothetical protein